MRDRSLILSLGLLITTLSACAVSKPQTLYLARHGQTPWNRVSRFQGDPGLDSVGYVNRFNLWMLLRDKKIKAIYTSALKRTQMTAKLVARQHKVEIQPRAEINEIASGVFEGICFAYMVPGTKKPGAKDCMVVSRGANLEPTKKEIARIWSEYRKKGIRGRLPLAENYFDMKKRAKPFVSELKRTLRRGETLVVGHGLINRVLLHLLLDWPLENVKHLRQGNDQVYRMEGLGTPDTRVYLYTSGHGWKRCSAPKAGDKHLDCSPCFPGHGRKCPSAGSPSVPPTSQSAGGHWK
ncbi:MAG: histidine phosphatase family protein [Deltaproteobacteria bacterium]|nr:histidine phosphatase family protein [Deltaproteobacteria bacterium]